MKNYLKVLIGLVIVAIFNFSCERKTNITEGEEVINAEDVKTRKLEDKENFNKMKMLLHGSMQKVYQTKRNGDPDHDFALMMANHHEGGIEMAEEQLESGSDTMLINMARKSISVQKEEQEKLRRLAKNLSKTAADTTATSDMMQPMKDMLDNMDPVMRTDTDQRFAELMKLHHQSGIDLADIYLPKAKNAEIKSMAEKIKGHQLKEKGKLEDWLQKHK